MCALSPHQVQQKALLKFSKIFAQISKYLKIKLTNPGIQGRSAKPRWCSKTNHLVSGASHTHKKHNWWYNFYFSIHLWYVHNNFWSAWAAFYGFSDMGPNLDCLSRSSRIFRRGKFFHGPKPLLKKFRAIVTARARARIFWKISKNFKKKFRNKIEKVTRPDDSCACYGRPTTRFTILQPDPESLRAFSIFSSAH